MTTLFFTPTSCGAASYIAAHRAGIIPSKLTPTLVDIKTHTIRSGDKKGASFFDVNPKGNVPTVVLEDGTLLNENAAVLQYIADQNFDSGLAPQPGTSERYVLQAKLNYISSELHASCGPLFNPAIPQELKPFFLDKVKSKLDYLSKHELKDGKFLLGDDTFTVADAYLYIITTWLPIFGIQLDDYPIIKAYSDKIKALGYVKEAHAAMAKMAEENT